MRYLEEALNNLNEISLYISNDNPYYAKVVLGDIKNCIDYLKLFPLIGKEIEPEIREIIEIKHKFRIIYSINKQDILIISIFKNKNIWN